MRFSEANCPSCALDLFNTCPLVPGYMFNMAPLIHPLIAHLSLLPLPSTETTNIFNALCLKNTFPQLCYPPLVSAHFLIFNLTLVERVDYTTVPSSFPSCHLFKAFFTRPPVKTIVLKVNTDLRLVNVMHFFLSLQIP